MKIRYSSQLKVVVVVVVVVVVAAAATCIVITVTTAVVLINMQANKTLFIISIASITMIHLKIKKYHR